MSDDSALQIARQLREQVESEQPKEQTFELEENPFVRKEQTCGYSVADFNIMLYNLNIRGFEI